MLCVQLPKENFNGEKMKGSSLLDYDWCMCCKSYLLCLGLIIGTFLVLPRILSGLLEVGEFIHAAEQIFMHEPTVFQLKGRLELFGDKILTAWSSNVAVYEYGHASTAGDVVSSLLQLMEW